MSVFVARSLCTPWDVRRSQHSHTFLHACIMDVEVQQQVSLSYPSWVAWVFPGSTLLCKEDHKFKCCSVTASCRTCYANHTLLLDWILSLLCTSNLPPSAPIGMVILVCVRFCSRAQLSFSGSSILFSSIPIDMLRDVKVGCWSTSLGIIVGTIHIMSTSVKLVPSVDLQR